MLRGMRTARLCAMALPAEAPACAPFRGTVRRLTGSATSAPADGRADDGASSRSFARPSLDPTEYDYELPHERIAVFPLSPRNHSRLLVALPEDPTGDITGDSTRGGEGGGEIRGESQREDVDPAFGSAYQKVHTCATRRGSKTFEPAALPRRRRGWRNAASGPGDT